MPSRGIAGGAPPKHPSERRRRNADPNPRTQVAPDDELRGPELPDEIVWHPMTRRWWDVWRRSPQAQAMGDTDWSFLLDTALLHHEMWQTGDTSRAAEVRLRSAKHGATAEDRLRLRMDIMAPEADEPEPDTGKRASTRKRRGNLHIAG